MSSIFPLRVFLAPSFFQNKHQKRLSALDLSMAAPLEPESHELANLDSKSQSAPSVDKPPIQPQDVPEYAENAVRAWCAVLGAWLLQFCIEGQINTFGAFQDYYATTWLKRYSASDISWIGSLQLFLELAFGFIGGMLYDAGYFRSVLFSGCILFVFSFFMLSLTQPQQYYQVFLSQGIGMGLGISLIYVPTFAILSYHFPKNVALPMGIVGSSGPLGGVVFTIMLNNLFNKSGFGWAVRYAAFIVLGCFALGLLLLSPPRHLGTPTTPPAELPSSNSTSASEPSPAPAPAAVPFKRMKDIPFLLMLLTSFTASLALYFPTFYVQLFASQHNVNPTLVNYALAILNVASIFGNIIPNYIADRVGIIKVFSICLFIAGALQLLMLAGYTEGGLIAFVICYGFFFGASTSLFLPAVTVLVPRDIDLGANMGIILVPSGVANLIGEPIAGALIGSDDQWWKGITFAAIVMMNAAVFVGQAGYRRWKEGGP